MNFAPSPAGLPVLVPAPSASLSLPIGAVGLAGLSMLKRGGGYTCRDLEGNLWTFGTYDRYAETD